MSGSVAPNRLLSITERLRIPAKYAPGVWARAMEAVKFITSTASVSDHLSPGWQHVMATLTVLATGLMTAFYGIRGIKWLGLEGSKDEVHGELSKLGKAINKGFPNRDVVTNAGNYLNVISTISGMGSRLNLFAGDPNAIDDGSAKPRVASEAFSVFSLVATGLMASLETKWAELALFKKNVQAAVTGGARGFVPASEPGIGDSAQRVTA